MTDLIERKFFGSGLNAERDEAIFAELTRLAQDNARLREALRLTERVVHEQRCERGTPWDLACVTIAQKVREHIDAALSTPANVAAGEGDFSIQERDDDMLIGERHWQFGWRCIARRPKLVTNAEWRADAERIVAALSSTAPPAAEAEVRPTKLTMPNGHVLECDYPAVDDWAHSWSIRYPDTGQIGTTQEQDWELVETYGLTALFAAFAAAIRSGAETEGDA
jgi:hypothetical protein